MSTRARITSLFLMSFYVFVAMATSANAIEIQKITSKKGVTAYLVEDHSVPLIAMRFSFKGGAATDRDDKIGLTNFLAGTLDEGAGDLTSTQYQQVLSDLSIKMNFSGSQHRFDGSLQTLSKNSAKAFPLLKLALTAPRFDEEPVERMRRQFIVSRKNEDQNPRKIASRQWVETMVGNHPYSRPRSGSIKTLKAITANDLRAKAKQIFTRDDLMIAVTGDITADALKYILDDVFGSLPQTSSLPPVPEADVFAGPGITIIDRDQPQSVIQFGHKGIKRQDKDYVTAFVLYNIFGSGQFTSRLMEEVREKRGLAYSAYAFLNPLDKAGLVIGSAATVNARVGETIKVIRDEFTRMGKEGPTKQELDNAISYLTGAYALRFDTNSKIAAQLLGTMKARLGMDYIKNRNGLIRAITLADAKRVAKRIFHGDQLVFTIVGKPKGVIATIK